MLRSSNSTHIFQILFQNTRIPSWFLYKKSIISSLVKKYVNWKNEEFFVLLTVYNKMDIEYATEKLATCLTKCKERKFVAWDILTKGLHPLLPQKFVSDQREELHFCPPR